ncbi:hypothetical protein [Nocardioides ultimimeridianus]
MRGAYYDDLGSGCATAGPIAVVSALKKLDSAEDNLGSAEEKTLGLGDATITFHEALFAKYAKTIGDEDAAAQLERIAERFGHAGLAFLAVQLGVTAYLHWNEQGLTAGQKAYNDVGTVASGAIGGTLMKLLCGTAGRISCAVGTVVVGSVIGEKVFNKLLSIPPNNPGQPYQPTSQCHPVIISNWQEHWDPNQGVLDCEN